MVNQVLKVSSGTCQQSAKVLSKSVTFLDFWLSQGSVATYCTWGGNPCDAYIANFLANHLVKEFWKSVHICQSYYQTSRSLLFLEHDMSVLYRSDTLSVKHWRDLEIWFRGCSRSLKTALLDRSCTTSYSHSILTCISKQASENVKNGTNPYSWPYWTRGGDWEDYKCIKWRQLTIEHHTYDLTASQLRALYARLAAHLPADGK